MTDTSSIAQAIDAAGPVDALVNNAGVGMFGALEASSMSAIRQMFETNTMGTIAMTQAVLPVMRTQRSGVIVNVSSVITALPLPMLSVYSASKSAVNAFTESLAIELREIGVRAHLVLPGRSPTTKFSENARRVPALPLPDAYAPMLQRVFDGMRDQSDGVTFPADVASAVWQAATDPNAPLKLFAGTDAEAIKRRLQA